ncbi:helix-turn-helix domain-containing protein [Streptomyces sp. NPDC054933]
MPGDKYEKYGRPVEPADPDAEYMTVQETAYVMKCSVSHLRRGINAGRFPHSRSGRRIVTNKADRARIYELLRQGVQPIRRRTRRTSKSEHRKPTSAAA